MSSQSDGSKAFTFLVSHIYDTGLVWVEHANIFDIFTI